MNTREGSFSGDLNIRIRKDDDHWLTFESKPITAVVRCGIAGAFTFGDFRVCESIREVPQAKHKSTNQAPRHEYTIKWFFRIETEDDLKIGFERFSALEDEIDAVWHYVFGFTYDGDERTGASSLKARGWSDNSAKVHSLVRPGQPRVFVEFSSRAALELDTWPLRRFLKAISAYRSAPEAIRFLMNLHAQAQNTKNEAIQLVLWGKILDLCEALMPGEDRREKFLRLPDIFKSRLVFDLDIFRMANSRSVTRHATDKNGNLYPSMSEDEIEDFRSDVDTIARAIVFSHIPIRPCFYEGWRFPANCSVRFSGSIGKARSMARDEKRKTK